ncbi:MAG: hypothetical protein GX754_11780 [Clostridiaceae bacterium]|nr:hypothetical protein [Clostridiaceae bacterium]
MYRIICESYKNFINDFLPNKTSDYRYKIMQPFRLILDESLYLEEKKKNSADFMKLEDFLYRVKQNIEKYPEFKSFLWSLESRNILGRNYGVLSSREFSEQLKILQMFLKLAYWD